LLDWKTVQNVIQQNLRKNAEEKKKIQKKEEKRIEKDDLYFPDRFAHPFRFIL